MSAGYYFLAWFVIGFGVALLVGRWFRTRGGITAQGGREAAFYNAYGRLELMEDLGGFFELRCAVCGKQFGRAGPNRPLPLPLSALHHHCPWIKKQKKN